jgi:hypothetical protein
VTLSTLGTAFTSLFHGLASLLDAVTDIHGDLLSFAPGLHNNKKLFVG